jgi:hypothetical protein
VVSGPAWVIGPRHPGGAGAEAEGAGFGTGGLLLLIPERQLLPEQPVRISPGAPDHIASRNRFPASGLRPKETLAKWHLPVAQWCPRPGCAARTICFCTHAVALTLLADGPLATRLGALLL